MHEPVEEISKPKLGSDIQENGDDINDDFSFVCVNPSGSPICADDAFVDGQIRPVFPMFDQRILFTELEDETTSSSGVRVRVRPQLKKLFMEEARDSTKYTSPEPEQEIYCEWSASASAPELGKKSHSTGFSKLWRFGDKILRRSNSDGKEAFVFLRNASKGGGGGGEKAVKGEKRRKGETASSLHERHYARNRAENEMNKRKSYLPYRSHLMGFFSTNIHPF